MVWVKPEIPLLIPLIMDQSFLKVLLIKMRLPLLIPPPAKVIAKLNRKWYPDVRIKKWPTKMQYLVAGYRGDAKMFEYRYSNVDYRNFMDTVEIVAGIERAEKFPKNYGKHCLGTAENKNGCPFFNVCFKVPNWKKYYKEKKVYG